MKKKKKTGRQHSNIVLPSTLTDTGRERGRDREIEKEREGGGGW